MPNYDYVCTACGGDFEFFQSMNDDPLTQCPTCEESSLKRKIGTGAGIIFKGTGFYETDYKKPKKDSSASEPKKDASESSKKDGSSDSGGGGSTSTSEK
jgi:putative FmdB family regulatory protein